MATTEETKAAVKQGNKEVSRKKFEYFLENNPSVKRMNELGAEGWEAWAMEARYIYYRREKLD